ncbi:MAG: YczE/YyaS/YitT family protein [Eubacteriaceae bacterium]
MIKYLIRILTLVLGLFLYGLGIVITMKANVGYAPWEVLHSGISQTLGISIGIINTAVGTVIVGITFLLGEKIGLGTILNMFMIGLFIDLILYLDFVPLFENFWVGSLILILGLFTIALGSYFYISSSFGAGPRDSLMVAITRKTNLPVGVCRGLIEVSAVVIGYFLGGLVGIGTVISAFCIGFCVQITFKTLRFDPTKLSHETFGIMIENIKELSRKKDSH